MSGFRQFLKRSLERALPPERLLTHGNGPGISLTFDDGPDLEHTPRLLDALARAGLRATFFVIGERAARMPDLVRRIARAGHELGNHTWRHRDPAEVSTRDFADEVNRTRTLLQDLTGRDCTLVRPPKGELTTGKLWSLFRSRQTVVLWNQDPRDYRMSSTAEIDGWCQAYRPAAGDIVLLHDNHPHATEAVRLFGTLPQFFELRFRTVSEWLSFRHRAGITSSGPGPAREKLKPRPETV